MTKNEQLDKAISVAVAAHSGKFDKGGKPYILHPLHLMNQLMFDLELAAIAVLHDVVEDSAYCFEDLKELGFSSRVISALILLTHDAEESYELYIAKVSSNYDAVRVKRKDLEHNSDITRLIGIQKEDIERIEKYHHAFVRLGEAKKQFCNDD